jgi:hypothetical protein
MPQTSEGLPGEALSACDLGSAGVAVISLNMLRCLALCRAYLAGFLQVLDQTRCRTKREKKVETDVVLPSGAEILLALLQAALRRKARGKSVQTAIRGTVTTSLTQGAPERTRLQGATPPTRT